MMRIILFLVVVGALALGIAWFADRPGDVIVTWPWLEQLWPGHGRNEISLLTLGGAILMTMAGLAILWSIIRAILRAPTTLANRRRHRQGLRAYEAISSGLIAVGSGDIEAAQRHASAIKRLAPNEPLALLLSAQSAQLSGDREGAERIFRDMAGRHDTKPLGLHGLYIEAHRRNDLTSARAYAEEAAKTAPSLGWASRAVLEARCKEGDWAGALTLLEANAGALGKTLYRRLRAVLLTAHAYAIEDSDRDKAKAYALEAVKLAPTLIPAAALAGRMLGESGEVRKATRTIDTAWRANPHPDLARAFSELRSGESARDRLKRIEGAAKNVPDNVESALAIARAAIDAREFTKARASLEPYLAAPTKRVSLLMAELERAEGDEGRAREWLARAVNAAPDPAWTADGHISDRWQPASPVTGRLDAFEWRVPLTGMISTATVIETEPVVVPPTAAPLPIEAQSKVGEETAPPLSSNGAGIAAATTPVSPPAKPVIPLVHAPDDPGTDDQPGEEVTDDAKPGVWRKIFG
jgi:HemY protein